MKKLFTIILFVLLSQITLAQKGDLLFYKEVAITSFVSVIDKDFDRSNGVGISPYFSIDIGKSTILLGPTLSIQNYYTYQNYNFSGILFGFERRLNNATSKKVNFSLQYHILYQRYINDVSKEFTARNYSYLQTIGYNLKGELTKQLFFHQSVGVGYGFGSQKLQPHSDVDGFSGFGLLIKLGVGYRF